MFRRVANRLLACLTSGFPIRRSPNNRLAALLDWRFGRRSTETRSSTSTSAPEADLWLFHQYDLDNRPYPEA